MIAARRGLGKVTSRERKAMHPLNCRYIALSLVERVNAQSHFHESEEVFNIDQLLEPAAGILLLVSTNGTQSWVSDCTSFDPHDRFTSPAGLNFWVRPLFLSTERQEAIDMVGQLNPPSGFNLHLKFVRNLVVGVRSCASTM
jgi:hypothetical protein